MRVCKKSFFLIRDPSSVSVGRQRLRTLVDSWGLRRDEDCDIALATVISELVTNAVCHGTGAMLTVGVQANLDLRRIMVEVFDGSPVLPRVRAFDPDAETGRGMLIVERLALSQGAEHTKQGKRVWAELALPEQPLTVRRFVARPRQAARAVARRISSPRRPRIPFAAQVALRVC